METTNYYRGVVKNSDPRDRWNLTIAILEIWCLIENKLAMQQMCKNIIFFFILSALVTTTMCTNSLNKSLTTSVPNRLFGEGG